MFPALVVKEYWKPFCMRACSMLTFLSVNHQNKNNFSKFQIMSFNVSVRVLTSLGYLGYEKYENKKY